MIALTPEAFDTVVCAGYRCPNLAATGSYFCGHCTREQERSASIVEVTRALVPLAARVEIEASRGHGVDYRLAVEELREALRRVLVIARRL